jgi:hypothetical protein
MIALLFISSVIMVYVDNCKHWGCILKNNTCSGCSAVMCRFCLKEPTNCTSDKREVAVNQLFNLEGHLILIVRRVECYNFMKHACLSLQYRIECLEGNFPLLAILNTIVATP